MSTKDRTWWRHTWMEAVYRSDLSPQERLIAAIYADHAWNARMTWVTITRLAQRAGMSERQARQWRSSLIEKKWLVEMEKARHHKAAVYYLSIPEGYELPTSETENEGLDVDAASPTSPQPETSGRRLAAALPDVRAEAERRQGGGSASSGRRLAAATPSSDEVSHPSSSSLTQRAQLAQQVTGLDEDDDLLQFVEQLLKEKNVSKAKAWMVKCHEAGDLIPMLESMRDETWGSKNYRDYDKPDPLWDVRLDGDERKRPAEDLPRCPWCRHPQHTIHGDHTRECPMQTWKAGDPEPRPSTNILSIAEKLGKEKGMPA